MGNDVKKVLNNFKNKLNKSKNKDACKAANKSMGIKKTFEEFKKLKPKNKKIAVLSVLTFILFIVSFIIVGSSLKSLFFVQESKIVFIDDNKQLFIKIGDTFIIEEMIVESGSPVPEISDYFTKDSVIQDDATILYYKDGEVISLDDFTFVSENGVYLRGIGEIDVVINNGSKFDTKLVITDTTSPTFLTQNVSMYEGDVLDLNSFLIHYEDNSRDEYYNVYLEGEYDYSSAGTYELTVRVCDYSDNCNNAQVSLEVIKKEETPTKPENPSNPNKPSTPTKPSNPEKPVTPSDPDKPVDPEKPVNPVDPVNENKVYMEELRNIFQTANDGASYKSIKANENIFLYNMTTFRQNKNLNALTIDAHLSDIARLRVTEIAAYNGKKDGNHSAMVDRNGKVYDNHVRPDGRVFYTFFEDYNKAYGTGNNTSYLEIYCYADTLTSSISDAFNAWISSNVHSSIMLNPEYNKMGVAKFQYNGGTHYLIVFSK